MIPALPSSLLACATCMADKGSLVGQAQGYAILFMLGMLAFMFYGGMLMTILPREAGVSWESHLGGALAGLGAALLMWLPEA